MIPFPPSALAMLARRILSSLVPDLKSPYTISDGTLVGLLLTNLASEMEQGIARRLKDIEAMKSIFRLASETLDADRLPARLKEALALAPTSMKMSDVNNVHDELTRVLIELHENVDAPVVPREDAVINNAIWRYLDEHCQRHKLD